MPRLSEVTGVKPDARKFGHSDKVADNATLIGVEVEIEHAAGVLRALAGANLWKQVNENSVRNAGIEIVTEPVSGSDIVEAMNELDALLKNGNPEFTERTGLHVHVDFRREDTSMLLRFIVLYLIFEGVLLVRSGECRCDNPYCAPLADLPDVLESIMNIVSTGRNVASRAISRYPKYTALNLAPLSTLGTVEFRSHEGTGDVSKIFGWINTILAMKKFASEFRDSPQVMIDRVCMDAEKLYNEVFMGHIGIPFSADVFAHMLDGARVAQEMYRAKELEPIEAGSSIAELLYEGEIVDVKKTKKGERETLEEMARRARIDLEMSRAQVQRAPRPGILGE